jgi:hypothetical protein
MVQEPSQVNQLSPIHVFKIGLSLNQLTHTSNRYAYHFEVAFLDN